MYSKYSGSEIESTLDKVSDIEKTISDNEKVVAASLNELNEKLNAGILSATEKTRVGYINDVMLATTIGLKFDANPLTTIISAETPVFISNKIGFLLEESCAGIFELRSLGLGTNKNITITSTLFCEDVESGFYSIFYDGEKTLKGTLFIR